MERDEENKCMYFMDGDLWCCVRFDFISLMEDPAGFGDTKEGALNDLRENELK